MEFVKTLLEQQPLMALFLTIAIGYLVGEINIKGFSLGVGAVLFVALAMGWFAPKSAPAPMVGTLGLALFLYAVGVQYGKQFFIGLTSAARPQGQPHRADRRAAGGRGEHPVRESDGPHARATALGLFAGSGTSTPTLQAAIATLGNDDPAVGYSVSYPFGVAGPDPVPVHRLHDPQAEDRGARGRRPGDARDRAPQPGVLRQDARRSDEPRCPPACRSPPCAGRTATSRPLRA